MVDVKDYLKTAGGNWLRAVNVEIGDKLDILGEGVIDDKTFDKAYLNVPVRLARTGENYSVRLGTKNVGRIAETLGGNTENWVGKQLEVISIETYSGLGQKGMLLKGVLASKQAELNKTGKTPSLGTVVAIRQANVLVEDGIPMSGKDWSTYFTPGVRRELLEFNLIVEEPDGTYRFTEEAKEYLE